jgi:hypothetical protein
MLDNIKDAITPHKSDNPYKNIILWSTDHVVAEVFFKNMLEDNLGYEWAGKLDVDLHNMPVWRQWVAMQQQEPWCLSLTPNELFLSEYQNYEYGVSNNMMATHEQQIKQWIYTRQVVVIQLEQSPELNRLQSKFIIKHE